ncbi:conserved membrane hypothetical protein [Candidatus Sulfopaludibacter sp. SbA4]|nr:conserved membrane hypothetical protein [Candidatus Sulfopaludibacter sp. SbA4]
MLQDLKYAFRVLRGNPGVTAAAWIALAFGIGANTAIFSLMDAVVLRPLPYPQPDRLMMVYATAGKTHRGMNASFPMVRDWQEQNRVFDSLSAYSRDSVNLTGGGEPLRLYAVHMTPEFFPVIGIAPAIGAAFDSSGQSVVITYGLWTRRFGGAPGAIGRPLVLDGQPYTLAGVLPQGFHFPKLGMMDEPEVYLPLAPHPNRRTHFLAGIGRLKPGITRAQAQADLDVISTAIEKDHPSENRGEGAQVSSLYDTLVAGSSDTLRVFVWAVGLVLLIACANVSNLLLSQAVRRKREIAIRSALGATRARLVRQLLAESLVLSLSGGAMGLLLALWGIPLLTAAVPIHTAFSARIAAGGIHLNGAVLGFTFVASVVAGLVFGSIPAWHSVRLSLGSRSPRGDRLRGLLIAAEVALSLMLLAGAGLLAKSFLRLLAVDPGFRTQNLLAIDVELPDPKYAEPETRAAFARQVLDRLEHLPGAAAVAAINAMPMTKSSPWNSFNLPGGDEMGSAGLRAVSPGYFQAMGIPLVRGRLLAPGDTRGVGVINRAMAERYWPNQDPIGKTIETPRTVRVATAAGFDIRFQPEQFQIVGIVGDVRHLSLVADPRPEMFLPYAQMATSEVTFVLRGVVAPREARSAIWAVDRDQPLAAVRTMDQLISDDVAPGRFVLLLLGVFAGVALALAAAGIFGVVLHSVSQRAREIGIRMAMGAGAAAVVRMVVRQAMLWIAIGLALGSLGALASVRLLASYLYGVRPRDPSSLAIAVVVLAALGALAAFLPARAAARVDPAATLRCE